MTEVNPLEYKFSTLELFRGYVKCFKRLFPLRPRVFFIPKKKLLEMMFYHKAYAVLNNKDIDPYLLFHEYMLSKHFTLKKFLLEKLKKEQKFYSEQATTAELLKCIKTKTSLSINTQLKKIERQRFAKKHPLFNLGHKYSTYYIFGIKNFNNLYDVINGLITCCLSQQEPIWSTYEQTFDTSALKLARREIIKSSYSQKKIYFLLKGKIDFYKKNNSLKGSIDAFNKFCSIVSTLQLNTLNLFINGIQKHIKKQIIFDSVNFVLQKGAPVDIFCNETTGCCSLAPTGKYWNESQTALGYLTDPNVALLQFTTTKNDATHDLIGVAILAICKDINDNVVLLVDSVEVGGHFYDELTKSSHDELKKRCLDSILQISKEVNAKYIFLCSTTRNRSAKLFASFVRKEFKLAKKPVKKYLKLNQINQKLYLDAFYDNGDSHIVTPKGIAEGYTFSCYFLLDFILMVI